MDDMLFHWDKTLLNRQEEKKSYKRQSLYQVLEFAQTASLNH